MLATLSTDTTWDNTEVHEITEDLTVAVGATLTIQPGTIVKFHHANADLFIDGALDAQGTATEPIVFTSLQDDVGGDTNGDGGATSPAPGNWARLQVNGTATISNAQIRYGGYFYGSMIQANGGSLTLSDSVIGDSESDGVRAIGSDPVLTNNEYRNNADAAISMDLNSNPSISGVTISGNGINGLQVDQGSLGKDLTWDDPDIVYWLNDDVVVPSGVTLQIEAGQIVKPAQANAELIVDGTLDINGTAAEPVVFTSALDDARGGDTNGDGSASVPAPANWARILMRTDSLNNTIDHLQSHYGGYFYGHSLQAIDTDLSISNSTFAHSDADGVRLDGTDAVLTDNVFTDNADAAVSMGLNSNPTITGVTVSGNGINGLQVDQGALGKDLTWDDPDIVYWLNDDVVVPSGVTLQIEAGQVVKPAQANAELIVDGTLDINGTAAEPVVFTSALDDARGGDTNGDGSAGVPAPANWARILMRTDSLNNTIDHLQSHYGGYFYGHSLQAIDTDLSISNSTFAHSDADGVRLDGTDAVLTNNMFTDNADAAISMELSSNPSITGVTISGNGINGLQVDQGSLGKDLTWDDPDIVYWLNDDVVVPSGVTLQIEAGQVVKPAQANAELIVDGTLDINGTAAEPVVFTSALDDARGGDTNGDDNASTPAPANWARIQIRSDSSGNTIDYLQSHYGGYFYGHSLQAVDTDLSISNSTFAHSDADGVRLDGTDAVLTNNVFTDNADAAVSMDLNSNPTITGVTVSGNGINGLQVDQGSLGKDLTWDDPDIVYWLNDDVVVPSGVMLQIEAGQVVKPAQANAELIVDGTLDINGTAAEPVVFTSALDDARGGDTNGDGSAGVPAPANWARILMRTDSLNNTIDHLQSHYGGYFFGHSLQAIDTDLSISNSTFAHSDADGVRLDGTDAVLTNNMFTDNADAAISMDLSSNPSITGVTISGNGINGLQVDQGSLGKDLTWDDPDIVYWLNDDVVVPSGVTLQIEAGQVVKPAQANAELIVDGTLDINGTAAEPVVFTSALDDARGGDTNGDDNASTPAPANWARIQMRSDSSGNTIDYLQSHYGGYFYGHSLQAIDTDLSISNSTFAHSDADGVRLDGTDAVLTNNVFTDNADAAVSMDLNSNPTITGVTVSGNGINGLQVDQGSLGKDLTWDDPDIVYWLNNDVVVPSGMTLAVGAGQVIKAAHANVDVIVDGTLDFDGTSDAPVVLTAARDDSIGGDTNGDADASAPAPGQWARVLLQPGSLNNTIDHARLMYGGYFYGGMVIADDAPISVTNSLLSRSESDAFLAVNGATAQINNNIIAGNVDAGLFAGSAAQVTAINNTIDSNGRGVVSSSAATSVELTNNLISFHSNVGVANEAGGEVIASFNDVFNPAGSNYSGLTDPTGSDGNTSVDPKYFNPANDQYFLTSGSPAIDSADGDIAPVVDHLGNPRFDDPNVFNTGTGTITYVDRGALERQEISTSNTDLATTSVAGPTSGIQDDVVTVNWTVESVGSEPAAGSWYDSVYLSVDTLWTPDDIFLAEFQHTGSVGPGQSYSASGDVELPGVLPGDYYFIVRTDIRNEVFEALNELNNSSAAAETITVDLPALVLDQPTPGQLDSTGDMTYFKVTTPAGADLLLDLTGPAGHANELFVSFGQLPTRQNFDHRGIRPDSPDQSISFGDTQAGTYHVLVYGADLPAAETFTLTASLSGFGITGVTPFQGSNTGQVTISVRGAQFDGLSTVRLVDSAGSTIDAVSVYLTDSGLIHATFDLTGAALGLADVQVVNQGDVTTSLADSFNVVAGVPGRLATNVIAPSRVRLGREFEVIIEYSNQGDTDLLAPVMRVAGQGLSTLAYHPEHLPETLEEGESPLNLSLVGVGPTAPAGVLPPGAHHTITLYGRAIANGDERFELILADYPNSPPDWEALKADIFPSGFPDELQELTLAEIVRIVGTTWDGYQQAISDHATLLPPALGSSHSLTDVFQLIVDIATSRALPSVEGSLALTETGMPLPNATLQLFDPVTEEVSRAVSLMDGSYVFPAIQAGTYTISAKGFVLTGATELTVPEQGLSGVALTAVPGGTISGAVRRDTLGAPLRNVTVTASLDDGRSSYALTGPDGTFVIDTLPAGQYTVRAGEGNYVAEVVSGVELPEGGVHPNLVFTLQSAATISGVVTGPGGGPVDDAVVTAKGENGTIETGRTDSTGAYDIVGLSGQSYEVSATATSLYTADLQTVDLAAGGVVSGVAVSLATGGAVEGAVVSSVDGQPVPYLLFTFESPTTTTSLQADADGMIPETEVPPGTYTMTAADVEFMTTSREVTVTAGGVADAGFIAVPRGEVSGLVTNTIDGTPVAGVTIRTVDDLGLDVITATDADGRYVLTGLDIGAYTIVLGDWGTPGASAVPVALDGTNRTATADFSMPVAGFLSGRVLGSDGATPVDGAEVALLRDGQEVLRRLARPDGDYSFIVTQPGTYQVEAGAAEATFTSVTGISVADGARLTDLDLVAGSSTIAGAVTDADTGLPIEGAVVEVTPAEDGLALTDARLTETDASGQFAMPNSAEGTYQIIVRAVGYAFGAAEVVVAGVDPDPVALALGAEAVLTGHVRQSGKGVPGAQVVVAFGATQWPLFAATTDDSGHYRINNLAPGTYTLIAFAEAKESVRLASVALGQEEKILDLAVDPSTTLVTGVVGSASGPLSGVVVTARNADGIIVASDSSGLDGSYELDSLPPGEFDLRASAGGYGSTATASITLSDGQTLPGQDFLMELNALSDPDPQVLASAPAQGQVDLANIRRRFRPPRRDLLLQDKDALDKFIRKITRVECLPLVKEALETFRLMAGPDNKSGWFREVEDAHEQLDDALDGYARLTNRLERRIGNARDKSEFERVGVDYYSLVPNNLIEGAMKIIMSTQGDFSTLNGQWSNLRLEFFGGTDIHGGPVPSLLNVLNPVLESLGKEKIDPADMEMSDLFKAAIGKTNDVMSSITLALKAGNMDQASKAIDGTKRILSVLKGMLNHWAGVLGAADLNDPRNVARLRRGLDTIATKYRKAHGIVLATEAAYDQVIKELTETDFEAKMEGIVEAVKAREFVNRLMALLYLDFRSTVKSMIRCQFSGCGSGTRSNMSEGESVLMPALAVATEDPTTLSTSFDFTEVCTAPPDVNPPESQGLLGTVINIIKIIIAIAFDPNDKIGPSGSGAESFIQNGSLQYEIQFENDPDLGATIPAQEVFVTDQLDENLDLNSVEFRSFGFNNFEFEVPPGLSNYETIIDLRPDGIDLLVPVELAVDKDTRIVSATFRSLDPLTLKLPDEVDAGFLPVNDKNLHNGEGFFTYSVATEDDLTTGTEITNQASIVFDINDPILTPTALNTIDAGAPTSTVSALPEAFGTANFMVDWSGQDDSGGSGIDRYDVYVSKDNAAFELLVAGTADTQYEFTGGESGSTYGFVSIAHDSVGNAEPMPLVADTETLVIIGAWVNRNNVYDVNAKDGVTTIDALMVINQLWRKSVFDPQTSILTPLPPSGYAPPYYDVTDDGKLTSLDALRVINYLHRQSIGNGETIDDTSGPMALPLPMSPEQDAEFVRAGATEVDRMLDPAEAQLLSGFVSPTASKIKQWSAIDSQSPVVADADYSVDDLDRTLRMLADDVAQQWAIVQ